MAIILRNSLGVPLTFTQGDDNLQWLESGSLISASVSSSTTDSTITLFRRSTSNTATGTDGGPVTNVVFSIPTATISGSTGNLQDVTTLGNQTSASLGITGSVGIIGAVTISSSLSALTNTKFGNNTTNTHQFTGSVSISGSLNATASTAISASYVNLIAGPGIRAINNNKVDNSFTITASLLTVNGIFPDANSNIATALTAVYVGDSGSFQVSQSLPAFTGSLTPGTIWVFANSTGSASGSNGQAFIYSTGSAGSGSWYPLGSANTAQYDSRYLMLAGTNSPMQGNVNWGGYQITGLATGSLSTDAVNLGQLTASLEGYVLTASFNNWTGSNLSYFFGTSSNADTASYIDVTGSGVLVNWNGTQLQLTASGASLDTLQDVTTRGNITSRSIDINDGTVSGGTTNITGSYTFTHGKGVTALGTGSHAEGESTTALGIFSHVEGWFTTTGDMSAFGHAEGELSVTIGYANHAEGHITTAVADYSHAEGELTTTTGGASHAEGYGTIASGFVAHTEGWETIAIGESSHAEGYQTTTTGNAWYAHAEGINTTANGSGSHAEGLGTIAVANYQHVEGRWNLQDNNALTVIGNGLNAGNRSNIAAVYTDRFTVTGSIFFSASNDPSIGGNNLVHLVPGTGIIITSGSTGYIISASGASGNLQDVTTLGNQTTQSVSISTPTGNYFGGDGTTGSLAVGVGHSSSFTGTTTLGNTLNPAAPYQTVVGQYNNPDNTALFIIGDGDPNTSLHNLLVASASYIGISGSVNVTGGITTPFVSGTLIDPTFVNFVGTASWAISASYVPNLQDVTTRGNITSRSIDINDGSVVGGTNNTTGSGTFTVGTGLVATGTGSIAFGNSSEALATYSHAEGEGTTALGYISFAQGDYSLTRGTASVALNSSLAEGKYAFSNGFNARAVGTGSHAEGFNTTAVGNYQHVEGSWNILDTNALWIVGDGSTPVFRHNLIAAYPSSSAGLGQVQVSGSIMVQTFVSASTIDPNFVNFVGTASWAQKINITGSGIIVNTGSFGTQLTASALPAYVFISSSAPTTGTPSNYTLETGSLWWDDVSGTLYVYYCDANTCQWVDTNGGGSYNPAVITDGFVLTSSLAPQTLTTSWTQTGATQLTGSSTITGSVQVDGFYVMSNYQFLNFTDDTAAAAGGVPLGGLYRTGNMVVVRLT